MKSKLEEAREKLERSRRRVRVFQVVAMRPHWSPEEVKAFGSLEQTQRAIVRMRKSALAFIGKHQNLDVRE
jgi:FPC/CPF motif-containing protein YcgG